MIDFRDFAQELIEPAHFLRPAVYGDFGEVLRLANEWIASEKIQVLNIETVVLPNLDNPREDGTEDPEITTFSSNNSWNQFIRVWFKK